VKDCIKPRPARGRISFGESAVAAQYETLRERCQGDAAAVAWPPKVDVFGIGVTPTHYDEATAAILEAARQGLSAVVSCHAVHALITSSLDPGLAARVNTFEMITPDGQPVRWALNLLHAANLAERVYGPELMLRVCRGAAAAGISIYLYGGRPGVTELLESRLSAMFPGLKIAGAETPPFSALSREENEAVIERINSSHARLVFIGLGFPKQDVFAHEHRDRIRAVQICVGAAFDFHAGVKRMAPRWMQRWGLEWLYRLLSEPRRLAWRYLTTNSIFAWMLLCALLRRHKVRRPGAAGTWKAGARGKRLGSRPEFRLPQETEEALGVVLHHLTQVCGQSQVPLRVIGLTSCSRGEGVSTVVAHLAMTAASCHARRVILVEAHLANPSVHRFFGLPAAPGWQEVLRGDCPVSDAIRRLGPGLPAVLTAGDGSANLGEFYASAKLEEVMRNLQSEFDLILLDMPDGSQPSRLLRTAGLAEGILMVVASERVQAPKARSLRSLLAQSGANMLGVVVNKQRDYVPRWLRP